MKVSFPLARIRLLLFVFTAVLHVIIIVFVAFRMDTVIREPTPEAVMMRLVDIQENYDPLPPAAPREITSGPPQTDAQEAIAEFMVETDTTPPTAVIGGGSGVPGASSSDVEGINYLPQSRITSLPVFPEDQIRRAVVYPPIAQRSNIEGVVFLELFIDRFGSVRDVRILRENPPDRGFGEAAVNAFKGIRAKPAEADGVAVAVRYRYNINFKLN